MAGPVVVITGAGLISPLGDSVEKFFSALCNGTIGLSRLEQQTGRNGDSCCLGAPIRDFRAGVYLPGRPLRPLDRTSQLAASAASLALEDSGWTTELRSKTELGLVLGTMFGGVHTIAEFDRGALVSGPGSASPMAFANTVINAAAGQTAIWHNLRGVNTTIAAGSVSGLTAIGHAADLLRSLKLSGVLAGGTDEFCFESFYGFERAGLLCRGQEDGEFPIPFDRRRNGFALGEGAAFVMLEDREIARARGAKVLAQVLGHGNAFDCSRGADVSRATRAIARAMNDALSRSAVSTAEIGFVSASANGSIRADCHESAALKHIFGDRSEHLPVCAIKCSTGDALGASGPLQLIATVETLRQGKLPGIAKLQELVPDFPLGGLACESRNLSAQYGLINAVGLDGNVCSLVVGTAESEPEHRADPNL
jgi:3-oxoacyl-[acyl-carrier-protein] synthase II